MFRDYNLTTPATKRSWPQKSMRAPRQKPATTESRRESERRREKGRRCESGAREEREEKRTTAERGSWEPRRAVFREYKGGFLRRDGGCFERLRLNMHELVGSFFFE